MQNRRQLQDSNRDAILRERQRRADEMVRDRDRARQATLEEAVHAQNARERRLEEDLLSGRIGQQDGTQGSTGPDILQAASQGDRVAGALLAALAPHLLLALAPNSLASLAPALLAGLPQDALRELAKTGVDAEELGARLEVPVLVDDGIYWGSRPQWSPDVRIVSMPLSAKEERLRRIGSASVDVADGGQIAEASGLTATTAAIEQADAAQPGQPDGPEPNDNGVDTTTLNNVQPGPRRPGFHLSL